MKPKAITGWLGRPIPGWCLAALGAAVAVAGAYELASAFYVKPAGEYATPAMLQAFLSLMMIGFGAICMRLGLKGNGKKP